MTISTTIIKNSYSGNGSTTAFTYNFKITAETEIEVIVKTNATGAESVRSIGTGSTNYAVSGVGDNSGTVTFVTAPTNLETVVLRRSTTQTQAMDLIDNDPMSADTIETAHDKSIAISQELQEQLDRSLKISRANTMTSTEFVTSATDRANKVLAFDSSGELAVTQEIGTYKGTDATTTTAAYVQRDIIKSTTTAQLNNVYICVADAVVGDALTDTDHFALLIDAVTAASSATAAASSATAAASSATAAAASYDSFDDRYLGAKSSDPSTDNDGASLATGAIYFKTDGTGFKVWNGSAWKDVRPTDAQQTNIDTVAAANSNISALAASAVIADMALLATTDVIADMALLATTDVIADMNTLATTDIVSDLNTLATSDIVSDLNTLATSDIVSDINTLATSDIVSDLNTLATSAIVTNLNTVASNISGVNSFAERYRVGSSDPSSDNDEGDIFYNSTSNVVKYYDGSAWQTITAITSSTITGQTAETSIADDDLILVSDTSASGALRKMTKANFVTGLGSASSIADTDADTKIQVEESSDEDKLRFDTGGTERAVMDSNGIALTTNGGSFIHHNTIANDTTLANQNMLLVGSVGITGTLTIGSNSTVVVI